jgi:hypothetical protein
MYRIKKGNSRKQSQLSEGEQRVIKEEAAGGYRSLDSRLELGVINEPRQKEGRLGKLWRLWQ